MNIKVEYSSSIDRMTLYGLIERTNLSLPNRSFPASDNDHNVVPFIAVIPSETRKEEANASSVIRMIEGQRNKPATLTPS